MPRPSGAASLIATVASRAGEGRILHLPDLILKRARRFSGLLPEILNDEDPKVVHDLRVQSRRLEQVVAAQFLEPRTEQAQQVIRALKRARRAVARWRDCDVLAGILERTLRRVRDPDERRAWEVVQKSVARRRERAIESARRKLATRKVFAIAQNLKAMLAQKPHGENGAPTTLPDRPARDEASVVRAAALAAYEEWKPALARVCETFDRADAHELRIRSKRLRYALELVRDTGLANADSMLAWLKAIQDNLGRLHDRGELARLAARALANRKFLTEQPRAASVLLARLAAERTREDRGTRKLLTTLSTQARELDQWIGQLAAAGQAAVAAPDGAPAEPVAAQKAI